MKNLLTSTLVFCLLLLGSQVAQAQIKTPAASPKQTVEQEFGLSKITIEYNRPGMKGRQIFAANGLVPFGKMWRTGANASTKVTFDSDVKIQGQDLKKGKYALYTVPGKDTWEVIFYTNTSYWGIPKEWKDDEVALKVSIKSEKTPMSMETMTMMVGNVKNDRADIQLWWENTMISIPVSINTDEVVMKSIDQTMGGVSRGDYYTAARYYYDSGKDLNQAHEWAKKANEKEPKFWQLRLQSEIEAGLNKYDMAISTAQQSRALAMEAGNEDYVRINDKNIAMWKEAKGGKKTQGKAKMK